MSLNHTVDSEWLIDRLNSLLLGDVYNFKTKVSFD